MMNGRNCRLTRQEIDESELNQRLSEPALSHLGSCVSCRGFSAERRSLRELVGSLGPVTAPGDFEMRLRARLADEKRSRAGQPFFFRYLISTPTLAGAALLVVLGISLAWLAQREATLPTEIVKAPVSTSPAAAQPPVLAVDIPSSEPALASTEPIKDKTAGRSGNAGRESGSRNSQNVTARDYGTSAAVSYRQVEQRAGEVSLAAPLKPMVVSIQDDRGETRRISLPPVSFGAQRMVDNRITVSTQNSRSW